MLTDVPWDQALDVILRGNQLGYTVDGTIVRIAPIETLEDENKARQRAGSWPSAQAQAGDLHVRDLPAQLCARRRSCAPLLKGSRALDARPDPGRRAHQHADHHGPARSAADATAALIATLDRAEPQVEVEARIVQTTRDFASAIGVQWGLNGRMTPEIGNTTTSRSRTAARSAAGVGTQASGPIRAATGARARPATAVNLPCRGATSAIGLALGAVNGAFNLDVALSALERTGKGRVLSTPRLTTQNNIEAEVAQGIQIPDSDRRQQHRHRHVQGRGADAEGHAADHRGRTPSSCRSTSRTRPPDFSRQVNGIPPIDTQRAQTQVQVDDGATTVIGGIFVSREQSTNDTHAGAAPDSAARLAVQARLACRTRAASC